MALLIEIKIQTLAGILACHLKQFLDLDGKKNPKDK